MIVATGPLTSDALSADIARLVGGEHLYFYDAISPIVLAETIDRIEGVPRSRAGTAACGGSDRSGSSRTLDGGQVPPAVRPRAASTTGRATI